jgi:hypothetical protein
VLPSAPSPERFQRLASQLVSRDDKNTVRNRIGDINDAKIPTRSRLTDRYAGTFTARPILNGFLENLLDFRFRDPVRTNVRLPGFRIEIESQVHGGKDITMWRQQWQLPNQFQ